MGFVVDEEYLKWKESERAKKRPEPDDNENSSKKTALKSKAEPSTSIKKSTSDYQLDPEVDLLDGDEAQASGGISKPSTSRTSQNVTSTAFHRDPVDCDKSWENNEFNNNEDEEEEEDNEVDPFSGKLLKDLPGYYYDELKLKPQKDEHGGYIYSSFIPPSPVSINMYSTMCDQQVREEDQECTKEEGKIQKRTKYFDDPPPPSQAPKVPCKAKYHSMSQESSVFLQIFDAKLQDQLSKLYKQLTIFYKFGLGMVDTKTLNVPVDDMEINEIIVAQLDEKEFCRARIMKINHDEENVSIRDCDTWEYHTVPVYDVFYMLPDFLNLPFMVQPCKLKGLEFWHKTKVLTEMRSLIRELGNDATITSCKIDSEDGLLIVDLVCTSKKTRSMIEKTFSLNQRFLESIKGFTRTPRQFIKGQIMDQCHLTILEPNGEAWILLHSALASKLAIIGENPKKKMDSYDKTKNRDMSDFEYAYSWLEQRVFLARYNDDRTFYRVKIVKLIKESKKAQVQYIDYGNTEIIPMDDIMPIDFVDSVLKKIPMQVFSVVLNGIKSVNDADQLFEYVGVSTIQRAVIAGFRSPNVPIIDLYAKSNPDDPQIWVYINQFMIEKGIATGDANLTPYKCSNLNIDSSPEMKSFLNDNQQKIFARKRYLATCRIVTHNEK